MAKVQQKSEKITAFGGIFFVLDKFDWSTGDWYLSHSKKEAFFDIVAQNS